MPNYSASRERGLNIYLFKLWLFISQQRTELSLTCFAFFFFPEHVPFYFDGLNSSCSLLLLFKPQNGYFTPCLGTGMIETLSNQQSDWGLERKTLRSLKSRNGWISLNLCKASCVSRPLPFPLEAWPLPFRRGEFPAGHGKHQHNPLSSHFRFPSLSPKGHVWSLRDRRHMQAVSWEPSCSVCAHGTSRTGPGALRWGGCSLLF